MPFYTISADYNGGTYISQVRADDPKQAIIAWAEQLEIKDFPNLGAKTKSKIIEDLRREQLEGYGPVSVNKVINVWCESLLVRGKLMILDIIKTEERVDDPEGIIDVKSG